MPAEHNDKSSVKLSLPLDFQQELFQELRTEDELVVLARGLGLLRLVTNLLHSYDAAGDNLVVLVGADERENGWIGEALAEHAAISRSPKARGLSLINTDSVSVGTRVKMYSMGGIFSITSRILIVDVLSKLLNPETITGVIVLHAERVIATSLEAFILRIYRQQNKTGFLKAFSDNPEPLTTGFSPLTTMMRNLFLRKPSLWPRFHISVANSLEGRKKAEVIELEVPMTENMKDIQTAIMECVEVTIGELKKANADLAMEDWNLDSALHRNFDAIVRRQLDPVWHRISWRTRQMVNDLTLLRQMLQSVFLALTSTPGTDYRSSYLLTYDAVSFNRYLDTILAAQQPPPGSTRQTQAPWLFLDAAHTVFDTAKRRVYAGQITDRRPQDNSDGSLSSLSPVLEELPKWALLAEVLEEIERDAFFNPRIRDDSNGSILIMCTDAATSRQIKEYLQTKHVRAEDDIEEVDEYKRKPSGAFLMRRKLREYLKWKPEFAKVSALLFEENEKALNGADGGRRSTDSYRGKGPPTKRRRVRGGSAAASGTSRGGNGGITATADQPFQVADLLTEIRPTEAEADQKQEVAADPLEDMEDYFHLLDIDDLTIVHPYDGDMDEHVLEEVKPRYIIMYEPDAAFIRRVEVYRSSHTDRNVRVYFMYYGGSVEEQRYLSAVRKEKDAFTKLIKERGNMAVTLTLDAHGVDDPQETFLRTVNTRIAGGGRLAATAEPPRVVVDVREFRSSLPSLLHAQSMLVVPCMLTVGDYILTPDICVERKSIKDLIASFKTGRLYTQAETMLQHYKSPMLLIEFEQNKSFTLEPFADLSHSNSSSSAWAAPAGGPNAAPSDLQAKLVLLTLSFPHLKIIWSSSPYQTASIFAELKKAAAEPDPIKAVNVGLQAGETAEENAQRVFSQVPQDMLRAVPGVSENVARTLVLEMESVMDVANAPENEVADLVGKAAARQMGRFFGRSVFEEAGGSG
ncbi:MAG: hypothetical protein M1833_006301 [Piccolia ochrophora]|nr:MAG: hypothetical protein M1833_006301 [Piccolia ochrophora]